MECRQPHEWYELERGTAPREDAEGLRRHAAECAECRDKAESIRDVAAALERLAGGTRADLSAEAAESLFRRARVHGYLGRPMRRPVLARAVRSRWVRWGVPLAAAAAGLAMILIGLERRFPEPVGPRGALAHLVRAAHGLKRAEDLRALAPMARAAVSEELAHPEASADQVADLLLVAYIAGRPREDRQADDVNFLLGIVWGRRHPSAGAAAVVRPWPTLLPTALAGAAPSLPLAAARANLMAGNYKGALAALPKDGSGAVLEAWCLESLGRPAEAAQVLARAQEREPMACVLKADLALGAQDVAEALRQYETLAAQRDRYWFAAGYLYRYELRDPRGAGRRFQQVRDGRLAGYAAETFAMELAAAKDPEPAPLFEERFENHPLGVPQDWGLVRMRGGEFLIVEEPRGKALRQDEIRHRGAELLSGGPDWADYTLQVDVKVLESQGAYTVGASAYRRADQTGYVLQWSPRSLRIVKQFAAAAAARRTPGAASERMAIEPMQAEMALDEQPTLGWWYTLKLRVQQVDGGVSVAGKVWRTDLPEPGGWQVVWTDTGQAVGKPLAGGAAGVQIDGARVLVDNLVVTHNGAASELSAASH